MTTSLHSFCPTGPEIPNKLIIKAVNYAPLSSHFKKPFESRAHIPARLNMERSNSIGHRNRLKISSGSLCGEHQLARLAHLRAYRLKHDVIVQANEVIEPLTSNRM